MMTGGLLRTPLFVMILALLGQASGTAEEGTWDAYVPRTLSEVISQHESDAARSDNYFTSDNLPSRVKVIFLGRRRPLPRERGAFLDKYFKTVNQPDFRKLFKTEVLVKERDKEHWLPIQTDLIPSFMEEVKSGAQVEVLVTWLGAVRVGGKLEWIFTINEFQAAQDE